jgi:hypothetical protein
VETGNKKLKKFKKNVCQFSFYFLFSFQNKLGDTPLHAASAKGRLDCAEMLIEAGANVHAKNGQGKKPLDVASAANPAIGALLRTTMARRDDPMEADYLEDEEEEDGGSQG